jgi:choline dehydrogenase-like flavoprotein
MFADARDVSAGTELETDLCIVGAGAAGITLARELIGRPLRIALLESGGTDLDPQTQALYEGPVVGLSYFPLDIARLRYLGGTTNHWAGVCRPFDDADFESRAWIPFSGWPLHKSDVDPFYRRALDVVQLGADVWDAESWAEKDAVRPLLLMPGRLETRIDQIVEPDRRSFRDLYEDELRSAANVTVYLHANGTEVLSDESGTRATQVQVATLDGNRFVVNAKTFVLAVGGIENARLLLASRGRHPKGLGNQNDLVGRFFLEHPRFVAGVVSPADPDLSFAFYREHRVGETIIVPRIAISRETQRAEALADVQFLIEAVHQEGFERAVESDDVASLIALRGPIGEDGIGDLGVHVANVVSDLMTWHRSAIPGAPIPVPYPEVVGELIRSTPQERRSLIPGLLGDVAGYVFTKVGGDVPVGSLLVTARFEPVPNPDSRVTLVEQQDDLGMPRAQLAWRLSDHDRRTVRRAMEVLGQEIGRAGIGRLRILFDEGSDWPADLVGGYHLIGTTRMSDNPKHGVVDRDGRVHGTSNLYVAGSSLFPTAGSGNPTLLIVALALRLADHLSEVMG